MYRGDAQGDGHPPAAQLSRSEAPRLTLRWQHSLGAAVDGAPAVSGGVVVAGSANGKLAAYRLETGARLWEDDGLGPIMGSAAIVGQQVLIGTLTGRVYAVSIRDGSIRWTWRAPRATAAIWSSPTPYRSLLLIGVASQYGDTPLEVGRLVALDQASGRQLWSYCTQPNCQPGGGIWSSPMVDSQGRAFVGLGNPNDGVLAMDATTGRRLWETDFHPDLGRDLDVGASPVILRTEGRERIAVGSVAGDFKLLDAEKGTVVWSRQLDAGSAVHGLIGSPASDGTSLYVPSASSPLGVLALDPADGRTVWQRQTQEAVYSSIAVARGVLMVGTGEVFGNAVVGHLLAISTGDGGVLWCFTAGGPVLGSPAIVGSRVLVGDARGELRAFAPSG